MSEVQVKFVTKHARYAVPDVSYVMPSDADGDILTKLVKSLLKGTERDEEEIDVLRFSFYICGDLLSSSLSEHLEGKNISQEDPIEIEYVLECQTPVPENSLNHDDWVSSAKISGNWVLSGCYDNTVHIWSTAGVHKLTIPGHVAPVKSVSWIRIAEPLCSFVSTSHDENAIIWEWNQETNSVDCAHICKGHARSVDCVDFCPENSKIVTGSYDQTLKIWSTCSSEIIEGDVEDTESFGNKKQKTISGKSKTKTPLMTLSGHADGVSGIQWTHSEEVSSCSLDCTIRLWDIQLGGLKSQLNGSKAFLGLSYSPLSHLILSASSDSHIRLWDSRMKTSAIVKSVYSSHNGWVTCVKWSPNQENHFISGSFDHVVKLWDKRSPKAPVFDLTGHDDRVFCADWSSNDYIASGGADGHVKVYRIQDAMKNSNTS